MRKLAGEHGIADDIHIDIVAALRAGDRIVWVPDVGPSPLKQRRAH